MDELMTVAQVAEQLKLTEQTVRNLIFSTGSDVAPWFG
jgi:predicted transcriptional regulator